MSPRVVVFAGAGSMRCGAQVAASLACFESPQPLEIRLLDWNEERMDLIDRLTRTILKKAELDHQIKSSTQLDESLEGADHLILALYEDSARRMLAPAPPEPEPDAEQDEKLMSVVEHGLGDLNKPTPYEQLSPQTRLMIHRPEVDLGREEMIAEAAARILAKTPEDCRILNLMRDVEIDLPPRAESILWPPAPTEAERAVAPHQILRWIGESDQVTGLVIEAEYSPVTRWLLQV